MKLRFTQLNYVRMICCLRFIRDPSTHRPISRKQFYPSQNWSGKLLDFTFVFCSNKSVGRLQHSHFTNSSAGHLSRSKPVLSLQGDCRRRLCSETKLGLNRRYLYYSTSLIYHITTYLKKTLCNYFIFFCLDAVLALLGVFALLDLALESHFLIETDLDIQQQPITTDRFVPLVPFTRSPDIAVADSAKATIRIFMDKGATIESPSLKTVCDTSFCNWQSSASRHPHLHAPSWLAWWQQSFSWHI